MRIKLGDWITPLQRTSKTMHLAQCIKNRRMLYKDMYVLTSRHIRPTCLGLMDKFLSFYRKHYVSNCALAQNIHRMLCVL